jgi:hypothetical protein
MFAMTEQRSARHLSSVPWLGRRHGNRHTRGWLASIVTPLPL